MSTVSPYGTWTSPVTPRSLVEQAVGLSGVSVTGDPGGGPGRVMWVESRPAEGGRQVLVAAPADGGPEGADSAVDVVPEGFSVRTAVHEYGGRCHVAHGDRVVFSNWADQRLWLVRPGSEPVAVTPEPDQPRALRYADPVVEPGGRWLFCVRESHREGGEVVNELVAVDLDAAGATPGAGGAEQTVREPVILATGSDFYSFPRLSPDGTHLVWITWEHPDMPWDATVLWRAEVHLDGDRPRLGPATAVAGGAGESVTQPVWSPDGRLHYVSDRSGWWNIYDEEGPAVEPQPAEFAGPDWTFGNSSYGFDPDGRLVATWSSATGSRIGVRGADGRLVEWEFPFTAYSSLVPVAGGVVAVAASPTRPAAVVHLTGAGSGIRVLRASRQVTLDEASISVPQAVDFVTGGGETAHALLYLPANRDFEAPEGERPPVIVTIHGGPTSAAQGVFNPAVQYWTTRGFAVADVDYRGSSGYGREYRRRLDGAWGVADVEDCAAVVAELDRRGLVDGRRAVIRGGSAGGFTVLAALAFTDGFAAGASHYGVADLELLARDTHKFEARYLDGLVGPWPEAADVYRQRSPIHHVDRITSPLILFQGLEDMVVPPRQSELMYEALAGRGVPVAYLAFEGEQHGFRRAETVVAVMTAELEFYGRVLGFRPDLPEPDPDGKPAPEGSALEITNAGALSPRS